MKRKPTKRRGQPKPPAGWKLIKRAGYKAPYKMVPRPGLKPEWHGRTYTNAKAACKAAKECEAKQDFWFL